MAFYLVRVGEGAKYISEARKHGYVAIGWNEVPDLRKFKDSDAIKSALTKTSYGYSASQAGAQAGQLYRFGLEMQAGDIVLSPLGEGEYLVGKLGDYFFEEKPKDGCPYFHRRSAEWLPQVLRKDDMSTNLAYSVGGLLTVFSLQKYSHEIESLISGDVATPAEKPQRVRDVVLSGLMELDGREFEEFIRHVLEILGFSAETTQYVGDKGIDVNGVLNAEGLAEVTLRVQVKRVRGSIGIKEVLGIRGTLSQGEHPCLITLSTFTAQAREEAEAPGKIPVKLIDGDDLAGIILKHFDDLDDSYKKRFSIRKKRQLNIEDQFELGGLEDEPEVKVLKGKSEPEAVKWDTVVCAAKEDGFNDVFLGQKTWWAIRLNPNTISHIKYIAMYQVAPISQITYYGEVDRVELYKGAEAGTKYQVYLKGEPIKLKKPVGLGKRPHLKPQGPKYTQLNKILKAATLDDVWG